MSKETTHLQMPFKRITTINIELAEQLLGKFVVDALQGGFGELTLWARSAPISMRLGIPIIKIETARTAALNFMDGKISAGKLGELLGLMPGEISDFKRAVRIYGENE